MSSTDHRHVVIVGAGHGGANTAALLRQQGFPGRVTLVGAEPGAPYQRPPLSKGYLKGAVTHDELLIKPSAFYAEQAVDTRFGDRVSCIAPQDQLVRLGSGSVLAYDQLVLATGAVPRRLDLPGASLRGVHYLRNHGDALGLSACLGPGRRLVIIGGGYVGLEVAASARHLGCEVTVLEREARALARVAGPDLARFLVDHHAARASRVVTGAGVIGLRDGGAGAVDGVVLDDGSVVDCDSVLVGVGALPSIELALDAGIDCAHGVVVDAQARTSADHVFAVGDMTSRPLHHFPGHHRLESIPSAVEQAKQVAAAILGTAPPKPEVPWFWSDQFDLKIKIAGLVAEAESSVVRGRPEDARFAIFHLRGDRVVAAETVNSAPDFMVAKRLIDGGAPVDGGRLADSAVSLRDLAA